MRVSRRRKYGTAVVACLILALLVSATSGCHLVTRNPEDRVAPGGEPHTKIVDGYLHVWHIPCDNRPAEWVAPIIVTELYSRSIIYLNRDGTVRESPKPEYKTEEGRERLQKALADRSTVSLIVRPPECPE